MEPQLRFHPGALVKCPSCRNEVSAEELPLDPERPFICERCRARHQAATQRMIQSGMLNAPEASGGKLANRNVKARPAPSRSTGSGDKASERESASSSADENVLDNPSNQ